jgi:transposase
MAALKGEKTLAELAQQYDVHANQIADRKARLTDGAAALFGGPALGAAPAPAVDLKLLHAKIGELALENEFLSGALSKAGPLAQSDD